MLQLFTLLLFFAFGIILQKILPFKTQQLLTKTLNWYVITIALPALVVTSLSKVAISSDLLLPILTAWGLFFISVLFTLVASKIFSWSKPLTGALLLLAPFGNTSFLGIPFTKSFFGDSGVAYAIIYDQLGSFLLLATAGVVILLLYSGKELSVRGVVLKILTFPSFLALLFTLLGIAEYLPQWLFGVLKTVAATLTPAALIAIGLLLHFSIPKDRRSAFFTALTIKLLIAPLLLFVLFKLCNFDSLAAKISLFEAAMAPMVSASILAISANLEKRFVASTLGIGILLSFLTLPLIYLLTTTL